MSRILAIVAAAWLLQGCGGKSQDPVVTSYGLLGEAPTAKEDFAYSFAPQIWNPKSKSVSFSAENLPSWATLDPSSGAISGFPLGSGTVRGLRIIMSGDEGATYIEPNLVVVGDPLRQYSWHLGNVGQTAFAQVAGTIGVDLNLLGAVAQQVTGEGVKIAVSDTGLEIRHEDLADNIFSGASRNYRLGTYPYIGDPSPLASSTAVDHGTSVAGIIAAVGWNDVGGRGVAPKAKLVGLNLLGTDVTPTTSIILDQITGDFDIFNQSWGTHASDVVPLPQYYADGLLEGVTSLRSGKGALYVKSAGNDFYPTDAPAGVTGDSTLVAFASLPYTLVVGALNAKGVKSSYSSIGSNLWVSAFGGEFGITNPAIITTDRSGCLRGYSTSDAGGNDFQAGASPNSSCNYTSIFNGTSSAAPMVSGVVALMLEVNPLLGWRDVKHILAATAQRPEPDFAAIADRSYDPAGHVWEQAWVTNAAGYKFHNYYGFGRVDASAAVNAARSYSAGSLGNFFESSVDSGTLALTIPDDDAAGVTHSLSFTDARVIEAVHVTFSASHPYAGDLGVELTSPSGTKSILVHVNNAMGDLTNPAEIGLLSNAFYGESAVGTWTLKVIDGASAEVGVRALTNWKLRIYGHAP